MRVDLVTVVSYSMEDLKAMLTYTDPRGNRRHIPEGASIHIEDGEVIVRIVNDQPMPIPRLQEVPPNPKPKLGEPVIKDIVKLIRDRETSVPYRKRFNAKKLNEDIRFVTSGPDARRSATLHEVLASFKCPGSVRELWEASKFGSVYVVRCALAILEGIGAAQRVDRDMAIEERLSFGVPEAPARTAYWQVTNNFLRETEAGDES